MCIYYSLSAGKDHEPVANIGTSDNATSDKINDVSLYSVNNAWVLEIHGPINGNGHLHREAICTYDVYKHELWDHQKGSVRLLGKTRLKQLILGDVCALSSACLGLSSPSPPCQVAACRAMTLLWHSSEWRDCGSCHQTRPPGRQVEREGGGKVEGREK